MKCLSGPSALLAMLFFCAFLYAQEDAYVDARKGSEPERKASAGKASGGVMGCGHGCTVPETVKVEIVKLVALEGVSFDSREWYVLPVNSVPEYSDSARASGRAVEWTMRIVNVSQQSLYIPTSLSWSSEVKKMGKRDAVVNLGVSLFGSCFGQEHQKTLELQGSVELYGAPDKSSDVTTIEPGHWITIVGRGPACPLPASKGDTYQVSIELDRLEWYKMGGQDREESVPLLGFKQSAEVHWNAEGTWLPMATK